MRIGLCIVHNAFSMHRALEPMRIFQCIKEYVCEVNKYLHTCMELKSFLYSLTSVECNGLKLWHIEDILNDSSNFQPLTTRLKTYTIKLDDESI